MYNSVKIRSGQRLKWKGMKTAFLVCCIVALALIALPCTSVAILEISASETDDGVLIENVGNVDCLLLVPH